MMPNGFFVGLGVGSFVSMTSWGLGVGVGVGLQAPSALGSQGVGCGDGWRVAQGSLGFREGDGVGSRVSPPPPSVVGAGVGFAFQGR